MNKNQLARALGTSWQHLDNWERGRVEPTGASIRRIAEVLDVSADFLLGLREAPRPTWTNLEDYLRNLAPSDLTQKEEQWLRDAPVDHHVIEPRDYDRLLRDLRSVGKTHPKSGARPRVEREAIEARLTAHGSQRGPAS